VSVVIVDAELPDGRRADVRCRDGVVVAMVDTGALPPAADDDAVIDASGGAVLPGLHDHHLHLFALAAQLRSIDVTGLDRDGLTGAITDGRRRHPDGWLRITGWNAIVHGPLDRGSLDGIDHRPLRVQDTTGSTWFLNSAGVAALGLGGEERTTGRLFRRELALRMVSEPLTDEEIVAAAQCLASFGVTSLTDASVTNVEDTLDRLARVDIGQRLTCMTGEPVAAVPDGVTLGPGKIVLDDDELPDVDRLANRITAWHEAGRPVAVHCVTRVQLVLTLAALDRAGSLAGDRIEHAAVAPPELVDGLQRHRLTVVTQPAFVAARGDQYLDHVDADDQPWLYRLRGLLAAGVTVLGSSDAPFGPVDPWLAIAAAGDRRADSGRPVAAAEAIDAATAMGLYSRGDITLGGAADLCVVAQSRAELLASPRDAAVVATVARGQVIYSG
jgi:predicted amidohydrolase YtcJ